MELSGRGQSSKGPSGTINSFKVDARLDARLKERVGASRVHTKDMLRVVTFATDSHANAASLLRQSACAELRPARFRTYVPSDVDAWLLSHGLSPGDRGHGWYAWKSHVIRRELDSAAPGDSVLYLDSTIIVDSPIATLASPDKPVHLFALAGGSYPLSEWTSPRCMAGLGADLGVDVSALADRQQLNAAVQLYLRTPESLAFAAEYERLCTRVALIADEPGFAQHRHDQSILSVLAYSSPCARIDADPTQHGDVEPACGLRLTHHRQLYPRLPKVAVITATRGGRRLLDSLNAVQRSTLPNVEHWVVSDGADCEPAVDALCETVAWGAVPVVRVRLPKRTGADGWNGHRVYGSVPWLVDATHVAFLDDDNSPDPDHYARLMRALVKTPGARWAHSLRRVVDDAGSAVDDLCESLGGISHTVIGQGDYLIDTSCYLMEKDLAVQLCTTWASPFRGDWEADRELCKGLLSTAPHAVVRAPTLTYRAGSTDKSVGVDFFRDGNGRMRWDPARQDAYLFHFSADATAAYLAKAGTPTAECALDEWQPSLWRGLADTHNLLNGFTNAPNVPDGALCLVALCHPGELPLDFFAARTDLRRIVYTLESPNVRHAAQWDAAWLARHFDVALTYWRGLLDSPLVRTVPTPHNTHHFDADLPPLPGPDGRDAGVCVIAELRDLSGEYEVNGMRLTCLDPLRRTYVEGLAALGVRVTAHGLGWDKAGIPGVAVASAVHRSADPRTAAAIASGFAWNLIVENCDAEGYASEKLYDSFLAGTVPLYHGSAPDWVPRDAYVDLKTTPLAEVARLVSDAGALDAYRARIAACREFVLSQVGTAAFAAKVRDAIRLVDSA